MMIGVLLHKYTRKSEDIMLSSISATGHIFDVWHDGESKATKIAKGTTGNIALTAKWTVIEYTLINCIMSP